MFRLHPGRPLRDLRVHEHLLRAGRRRPTPCARSSSELGIDAGETTDDGLFTLRTVECYGGCGWGPVVSINERYHEPFPADRGRRLIDRAARRRRAR